VTDTCQSVNTKADSYKLQHHKVMGESAMLTYRWLLLLCMTGKVVKSSEICVVWQVVICPVFL